MRPSHKSIFFSVLPIALLFFPSLLLAQAPLISRPVDETRMIQLQGNTHPLARPEFDRGAAPADLPMNRMLLVLKRSPEQEAALRRLIDDQQDKASPNFHKWLTPEEFGQQFGPTDQDIQTVTLWLQSHGFQVAQVAKGRTVIEFSGSAAQVREALHTSIHKYAVNGEEHWANASDPEIPAALAPAVGGVLSLNNFRARPLYHSLGVVSRSKATGLFTPAQPLFTIPYPGGCGTQPSNCYGVGPYDFATIYNVLPLWNAAPAIDGTGQTIAIVGETDIDPQDVTNFRNFFGLPAPNLQVIHDGPAPGILQDGEETESDLDVEWSGAVAPGAMIDFVVAQSTETTQGIHLSALHIIDNNLAPVMSESYGQCELYMGTAGNQFFNQLWQQAAAEGITVMISTGDSGSAVCDRPESPTPVPARAGLQVSGYSSTPYNVAVGGTDFNDLTTGTTYWNPTNNTTTEASAKSYIPESTWNDSCTSSAFSVFGFSASAEANCNNSRLVDFVWAVGGSGGKSNCINSDGRNPASCTGGYAKPSWQVAATPSDGARDVPDVSLFAADGLAGSFYVICEADQSTLACNPNIPTADFLGIGGTSASAPAFAGIMALVNQQTGARQGNANYVLYKLAAQQPSAFHDVTVGTIAMPCQTGSVNCTTATTGDKYGILSGYNAVAGYDLATGLGSVNAFNLVSKWSSVTVAASVTTMTNLSPTTLAHGQPASVAVTVAPQSGSGATPTGAVSLIGGPGNSKGIADFALVNGTASATTSLLPGGTYSVTAHYPGDAIYGASDSSAVPVNITPESSLTFVNLVTFDTSGNLTSFAANTATYGAGYYLLRVDVGDSSSSVSTAKGISSGCAGGKSSCPTGNVALTSNGAPLEGGVFPLNIQGSAEDQSLMPGTYAISATYPGDSSYGPSGAAANFIIAKAPTTTQSGTAVVGVQYGVSTQVNAEADTTSHGAEPTGTFQFFVDGSPVGSPAPMYEGASYTGTGSLPYAWVDASTSVPFLSVGNHTLSAQYSGDANYATSTSAAITIPVMKAYPNFNRFGASPATVNLNQPTTLTALLDGSQFGVPATGTVTFSYDGTPLSGAVSYGIQDGELLATLPYTPTTPGTHNISASYAGDSNYFPTTNAPVGAMLTVIGPVSVSPTGWIYVTSPGQPGSVPLTISPNGAFSGTVTVSCAPDPLAKEAGCSFTNGSTTSPTTQVNLNGSSATVTLNVTTTAAHTVTAEIRSLGRTLAGLTIAGMFVLFIPVVRNRPRMLLAVLGMALTLSLGACGGGGLSSGSGSGGGPITTNDPGTSRGNYTFTVTATAGTGSSAITLSTPVTVVVQ